MQPLSKEWGESTMKIQLGGLSEGIHRFRLEELPEALGLGDEFQSRVGVDLTIDKTPNQVLLVAVVETEAKCVCDRCLGGFEMPVSTSYTMYYVTEKQTPENVDPSEFQVLPPGLTVVDIADDVRQTILLAIPLKLLCSENCEGLCPKCGVNLNSSPCSCELEVVDSRWEKLKEIRNK